MTQAIRSDAKTFEGCKTNTIRQVKKAQQQMLRSYIPMSQTIGILARQLEKFLRSRRDVIKSLGTGLKDFL